MATDGIVRGMIVEDPLSQLRHVKIPVQPVIVGPINAAVIPNGVTNWTYFEGAMLAVVLKINREQIVIGSAVVVAPGLAITASHLIRDRVKDIISGGSTIYCLGPTSIGLEIWKILKVSLGADDDIAYFSIELISQIYP